MNATQTKTKKPGDQVEDFPDQGSLPTAQAELPAAAPTPPVVIEPAAAHWRCAGTVQHQLDIDGTRLGLAISGQGSNLMATVRLRGVGTIPTVDAVLTSRIRAAGATVMDSAAGLEFRRLVEKLNAALADVQAARQTITAVERARAAVDPLSDAAGDDLARLARDEANAKKSELAAGALARSLDVTVGLKAMKLRELVQEAAVVEAAALRDEVARKRTALIARLVPILGEVLNEAASLDSAFAFLYQPADAATKAVEGVVPPTSQRFHGTNRESMGLPAPIAMPG